VSASNLVRIRSKMSELLPFNWFQNGGRRHLGFLHYVNFDGKSDGVTPFSAYVSNTVQMRAIMANLWPKMWFSIWRPPPSWILLDTSSDGKLCSGTLFSVSMSNLVRIHSKMADLWPFNWFQNGGRRHLGFLHYVNFDDNSDRGTPFSTYASNSVQMRAIYMAKLWPKQKRDFQYGCRRHLGFCCIRFLGAKVVEGICPIAAVCTALSSRLSQIKYIWVATLTLRLHDVISDVTTLFAIFDFLYVLYWNWHTFEVRTVALTIL